MHPSVMEYLQSVSEKYAYSAPVLEIGSININGSARDIFGHLTPYVGIDIVSGANVDHVVDIRDGDPRRHEFLQHKFELVIMTEVLEHVPPAEIMRSIWPLITHDKIVTVVITCASDTRKPHSADGAPELKPNEYYRNVGKDELYNLLNNPPHSLECLMCTVTQNDNKSDIYAIAKYAPAEMTEEEITHFIESNTWKFASSMPSVPHFYCLKEKCVDPLMFERFVMHIRKHGYVGKFWRKEYMYYNDSTYKYWTMGAPIHETILINRAYRKKESK